MNRRATKIAGRKSWVGALALTALAGCGGGGDSSTEQPSAPATGGNSSPTIQGSPRTTAVVGQAYSYRPTASDPDEDVLTFAVANLPAWATFDATTGRISGTPDASDVATYPNIRITVSDGQASVSTAAFAITVSDVGSGRVTLSWTPPTQNEDGSALSDLAGYEVLYGQDQADLSQSIQLTNPSLSTYVVENLSSGTWFFALRSVNTQGATSQLSGIASKTVG